VVTNADAVRQHLMAEGVKVEKIVTTYNGVDASLFTPRPGWQRSEALAAYNLAHLAERRFVTIVANLRHAVKDHPTFLRAAQRVKREVPEAAFLLAGEGELLEPMRALADDLGLAQNAFFIGRCKNVADLLALSEVCVLSSVAEGFSNAILEYMAAGRPVVATDVGGVREAVQEGETGHIVPVGDDRALAARICALLQAPAEARAMGECGQRLVQQRFSCATQLARTKDLYDVLLWRAELGKRETKVKQQRADGRDPKPEKHASSFQRVESAVAERSL
jgi:glycosyltransferase involved in cell wall biosynthesis